MASHEVFTPNYLARQIQACATEQFTGRLDLVIKETKGQQWSLYFRQGGLIWCASEVHPLRRWCRQLALHCSQFSLDSETYASLNPAGATGSQESKQPQYLGYNALTELVGVGKVQRGQLSAILVDNITEVLFDILQKWDQLRYRSALQLTYRPIPKSTIDSLYSTLVFMPADPVWQQAVQAWEAWQEAGLVDYSPNLAPVIIKAEELRRQTSPIAYQNLLTLADGNRSLRDLAVKLKQNLLPLTQSLMPYIRRGLMGLIEIGDLNSSIQSVTGTNPQSASVGQSVNQTQPEPTGPLVLCIDDSRIDSMAMSRILTKAGYRFIHVQEPVKALPTLLEHKPDLIFLDLVMPVVNGYEVCGQIRRVSAFKDTPVIILTSNDGIVDRVRAKMVGSSGFLAKPIDSEKVLATLQRHLPASASFQVQKLPTTRAWTSN